MLRDIDVLKSGIGQVPFVRLGSRQLTVHHEHPLHLVHLQTAGEIVNHLLVVTVSGEAFNLRDLRFDTVVTANFRMDETVLRSALVRADGRAAVYVDGQFQSGDQLTVETQPIPDDAIDSFRGSWRQTVKEQLRSIFREGEPDYAICVSVEEMLHVAFPDDGLDRHTIRLLAPDGSTKNHRIYLNTDEGWQRLYPDVFGSYYLFSAKGSEANMALVSTIQSWWVLVYIAGAVAVFALLVLALAKLSKWLRGRKKKERIRCETDALFPAVAGIS